MAVTDIGSIIQPAVWANYQFEEHVEKLDVFQAGLLSTDDAIDDAIDATGRLVDIPSFDDLASSASEPVNDDPADEIVAEAVSTRQSVAARNFRAKSWANMDIVKILARDDPMRIINARQGDWWKRAHKRTLLAILKGVFADNIANDASDLVEDTNTSITADDVIDAAFKQGDRFQDFVGIWMHSMPYKKLVKADLIDFVPTSDQSMFFPKYLGLNVLVDDGLPVNGTEYDSYLFKRGAVYYREDPVLVQGGAVALERNEKAGHGSGMTEVITRRNFLMHPKGWTVATTSFADPFPADSELDDAATWNRVVADKKHTGLALLRTTET